ncbi:NUDIX domain-containing protein [Fictibacillus phosphorivorans]|uniref:NUDIX domain-containing protein n=1 Tax=Fictibacillus phosphorivorans TaxID=1221500 RepID=UPI001293A063|nr:NUDIX domain-containing protein [Fictibacillus phosphorivorans]MQR96853.1 NUDIX domain-containing protein [Fictibacillus phosphorivorans]
MHKHRGIYCICLNKFGKLLVIEKKGGPYKNRFDLPGGTPDDGELEYETVIREVLEETGYKVIHGTKIGERCYELPWNYKEWTRSQHTAVFFECIIDLHSQTTIADIPDQDSSGTRWIHTQDLVQDWCSPLVWEAVQYALTKRLSSEMKIYKTWRVQNMPLYPIG